METSESTLDEQVVLQEAYEPARVVIRPVHFAILCVATLGIYQVWWMYKCWRYVKEKDNEDVYPALRAIFGIFYGMALFNRIAYYCETKGRDVEYNSGGVWGGFLVLNLLARLPEPFWIISTLSFVPLLKVVREFNYYFTEDFGGGDVSLNGKQIGLIVVGVIFWALIVIGMAGEGLLGN